MFAFILLSFGTAFGQTALENDTQLNSTLTTNGSIETIAVKQDEATSTNSNMNFVLWFMGSKFGSGIDVVCADAKFVNIGKSTRINKTRI